MPQIHPYSFLNMTFGLNYNREKKGDQNTDSSCYLYRVSDIWFCIKTVKFYSQYFSQTLLIFQL